MTQDISPSGARFETSQIYAAGDMVIAKIPWGAWARAGEMIGRVVRVEAMEETAGPAPISVPETGANAALRRVAVQWIQRVK